MSGQEIDERPLMRRPAWLLSAAVLALVVIGGASLLVTGGKDNSTGTQTPSSAPTPSATAQAAPACRLTDTRQDPPTAPPADVRWELFGPFALPVSASAGPGIIERGGARCYARTPLGAALAAEHLAARMMAGDDAPRVSAEQAMAGPGRDKWIRTLNTEGVLDLTDPTNTVQSGGFRVLSFTPQQAVVELTPHEKGPGQVRVYSYTLTWDGDWKMIVRPDGTLTPAPHGLPSADGVIPDSGGFVRWRAG